MFAESWDHNAEAIAQHTWIENGNISVLDFPLQKSMGDVFGRQNAPFESLLSALHLEDQLYQNVYELMSFYDNHDMPRLDATDNGFVNANNFLFTARGIPTIYYGSEIGFRAGRPEHGGNRDYFGAKNIALAKTHPIHAALSNIANVRAASIALQRGLQANVFFRGDQAAFYRVYEHEGVTQTALVLLNKADQANQFVIDQWLSHGEWREANGRQVMVSKSSPTLITQVAANGVQIWLFNAPVTDAQMKKKLLALQQRPRR